MQISARRPRNFHDSPDWKTGLCSSRTVASRLALSRKPACRTRPYRRHYHRRRCLVGFIVVTQRYGGSGLPPWATAVKQAGCWGTGDQPSAGCSGPSLPTVGADGMFVGLTQGWQAVYNAVHIDPLLEIKIEPTPPADSPVRSRDRHGSRSCHAPGRADVCCQRSRLPGDKNRWRSGADSHFGSNDRQAGPPTVSAGLGFAGRKICSRFPPISSTTSAGHLIPPTSIFSLVSIASSGFWLLA